jgi:hypothetical protein
MNVDSLLYADFIEKLAKYKKDFECMDDCSPEQITILLSMILKYTKKVDVYSKSTTSYISDSYEFYNAIKRFLHKGGKIRFLFKDYNEFIELKKGKLVYPLLCAYYSQVELKYIDNEENIIKYKGNPSISFVVADNRVYRMEEMLNPNDINARSNFNDVDTATVLKDVFEEKFKNYSKHVSLFEKC